MIFFWNFSEQNFFSIQNFVLYVFRKLSIKVTYQTLRICLKYLRTEWVAEDRKPPTLESHILHIYQLFNSLSQFNQDCEPHTENLEGRRSVQLYQLMAGTAFRPTKLCACLIVTRVNLQGFSSNLSFRATQHPSSVTVHGLLAVGQFAVGQFAVRKNVSFS